MKKIFTILTFIFFVSFVFAQPTTTPPPLKPIETNEKNADRLFQNGMKAFENKDYQSAIEYFEFAQQMYRTLGLKEKVTLTEEWLKKSDLAGADMLVEKAKEQDKEKAWDTALMGLSKVSEIYKSYNETEKVKEVEELQKKYQELYNKKLEGIKYMDEGKKAYLAKDYAKAKEDFTKARQIYVELDLKDGIADVDDYLSHIEKESNAKSTGFGARFLLFLIPTLWIIKSKYP